jgi:ligand-binding SRPBCC domain-containing protein
MRRHVYEVAVNTSPERLWLAIADVRRWPEWDAELEAIEVKGEIAPGSRFGLKPRGGPTVAMSVEAMEAPRRFVDVAHLPLAKMRTSHEFHAERGGTRIRLTIEVSGPLGPLWDLLVARKQAEGAGAQTEALVQFAERLS